MNKPAFTRNSRGITLVHLVYWKKNPHHTMSNASQRHQRPTCSPDNSSDKRAASAEALATLSSACFSWLTASSKSARKLAASVSALRFCAARPTLAAAYSLSRSAASCKSWSRALRDLSACSPLTWRIFLMWILYFIFCFFWLEKCFFFGSKNIFILAGKMFFFGSKNDSFLARKNVSF